MKEITVYAEERQFTCKLKTNLCDLCKRHLKNVSVDVGKRENETDIYYEFSEDGTLKNAEVLIMNRHENKWKEVRKLSHLLTTHYLLLLLLLLTKYYFIATLSCITLYSLHTLHS